MLIELLAWLGLKGIATTMDTIEDSRSKRNSTFIDKKGNICSFGRGGEYYINGEQTYRWTEIDKYDNEHNMIIGMHSGKVYRDSFDDKIETILKENNTEREDSIKNGYLAYNKYDIRIKKSVTTEISTGKIITCLAEDFSEGYLRYRKWYFNPKKQKLSDYNKTVDGDMGILISKKEYDGLHISCGSYSDSPSDRKIREFIYYSKGEKEEMEEIKKDVEIRNAIGWIRYNFRKEGYIYEEGIKVLEKYDVHKYDLEIEEMREKLRKQKVEDKSSQRIN